MKFNTIVKLFTALAAAVGAIYIVATYGDKIVAWAKKLVASCPCHRCGDVVIEKEAEAPAAPAEESAGEPAEQPAEAPAEPETPAAEPEIAENEPVAEENDFEG